MKKTGCYFLLLIAILVLSCANGNGHSTEKGDQGQNRTFETGKVIPGIVCLKDPSTTYALYLPKNYSSSRKFPVILAFDPHGSGDLPLGFYHNLA